MEGLYERETELGALSAALSAARSGAGSLVVIEGPAGIGKSRLLAEARVLAGALGVAVLSASGIELERDASLGVAGELFTPVLAPASAGERARLLSGHASLGAGLFDPAAPLPEDPSALVRGLYWLTVNAVAAGAAAPGAGPGSPDGERTPGLLIAVDDAQWADRPSLSYLAYLAARIDEL
ncbi:MAG: ATP-binding protein, partial [Trebonia sp.]